MYAEEVAEEVVRGGGEGNGSERKYGRGGDEGVDGCGGGEEG